MLLMRLGPSLLVKYRGRRYQIHRAAANRGFFINSLFDDAAIDGIETARGA